MPIEAARKRRFGVLAGWGCVLGVAVGAIATKERWLPLLDRAARTIHRPNDERHDGAHDAHDGPNQAANDDAPTHDEHTHDAHSHDEHSHDAHSHDDAVRHSATIELSSNGLENIGFKPFVIESTRYDKRLPFPAIVVERPGRSQLHITAPLSGVVTLIHSVTGEAVQPGQPLFEMRLMHEELVAAQRDYLRTAESLDVVDREIARLNALGEGVVAGRRILEQQYEKQRLEASLHAEGEAMLVHGISETQIGEIRATRSLLRSLVVSAPEHVHDGDGCKDDHLFQIQRLSVAQGEHLDAGSELAVLADHCELLVEGIAFEDDAPKIRQAAASGRRVKADLLVDPDRDVQIGDLEILYVADQIAPDSRAFKFYLRLPNEVVLDKSTPEGMRFIEWAYKPGQRMQLGVPIETWDDQWVLPTTAVVDEGAEAYVYRRDGDHFDQISVRVIHRDRESVVIAQDRALSQGDVIAGAGAYQLHLALKNQLGGGIDPHAGHNH